MHPQKLFIGIMSGTSLDGIDCALVHFETDQLRLLATHSQAYSENLKTRLLSLCQHKASSLEELGRLHTELGERYSESVLALLDKSNINPKQVSAIGNHGQTVFHAPTGDYPFTMQIGNNHVLAARTGILTIGDFRGLDIAYGGQGAPLAPAFHAAYFKRPGCSNAVVNVGGISNITLLSDAQTIGFDTGPGNVLMDGWVQRHLGQAFDKNGAWAASGTVNTDLLNALLKDPYFNLPAPKSTGRELFHLAWLDQHLQTHAAIKPADVQATLLALTAECIQLGIQQQNIKIDGMYLCGGGAYNQALLATLRKLNPGMTVSTTQQLGIDPSWVEAIAFAWLAKQALEGKPGNLMAVTGARQACRLGVIYHPK